MLLKKARLVAQAIRNRDWREDAEQQAWIEYLRYEPPRTPRGAELMARTAVVNILRKEIRQKEIPGRIKEGNHLKSRFTDRRRMRQQYLASHPRA